MRILLLVLAACSAVPPPAAPKCPEPIAVKPIAPPELSDAEVATRSDAVFKAIDSWNLDAISTSLTDGFLLVDSNRTIDREALAKQMQGRTARKVPPRTRTCEAPRVRRGARTVVYLVECTERTPAHDDMPESSLDGANTLVWMLDGDAWKLALWQWNVGGVEGERAHWNTMFKGAVAFKRTANQHMIDAVKGVKPGKALDIAMGQGRNALHLAKVGWKVTGVDFSDEAIRQAKEAAAGQKVALDAVLADIERYDLGTAKWDLVTLIYAGSGAEMLERIKTGLKPGGRIVVEFFHRDATRSLGIGGFETGALAKQFAGWKILTDEVVEDISDWGLRRTKLVRFTAVKP